jgi:hypothetical protein
LSVFDRDHPRPRDEVGADGVKKVLTEQAKEQMRVLRPRDADSLARFRGVLVRALRTMINEPSLGAAEAEVRESSPAQTVDGHDANRYWISRRDRGESIPAYSWGSSDYDGTVVVWIHPAGTASLFHDGKPTPAAQSLLDRKAAVLAVDVFGTGQLAPETAKVNAQYAGYTFGYNRPLLAERVHDILTAIAFAQSNPKTRRVHLVGWESAGPWVVLAKALAGDGVSRCAADLDGFRFDSVRSNEDPMMLPGALKYGGLAAFAALAAPGDLLLHNDQGAGTDQIVPMAYRAVGAEKRLRREAERMSPASVIDWLLFNP